MYVDGEGVGDPRTSVAVYVVTATVVKLRTSSIVFSVDLSVERDTSMKYINPINAIDEKSVIRKPLVIFKTRSP